MDAPLVGAITFKNKKSTPFSLDGGDHRLQFKPDCFFGAGDGGFEPGWVQIKLKYAGDDEDFVYSKAKSAGWDLVSRELDYETKVDLFTVDTQSNGEMRAWINFQGTRELFVQHVLMLPPEHRRCRLVKSPWNRIRLTTGLANYGTSSC